jgi:hypothetical protein
MKTTSDATARAIALIGTRRSGSGKVYTAYAAARETGIALSTIYRALGRIVATKPGRKPR